VGRGGRCIAGSPARPRWQGDPAGRVEGYSGGSWSELAGATPLIAGYMKVLYRMYGVYNVLFGLMGSAIAVTAFRRGERWAWWALLVGYTVALISAITYDKTVNAIGPFELSEYLGLAMVWGHSPLLLHSALRHGRFPRQAHTVSKRR
jgi:hypothetical protein